jgi:hypothetical protein
MIVLPIFLQMGPQGERLYIEQGLRLNEHCDRKNTLYLLPNYAYRILIQILARKEGGKDG